jgi:hypothetical protein
VPRPGNLTLFASRGLLVDPPLVSVDGHHVIVDVVREDVVHSGIDSHDSQREVQNDTRNILEKNVLDTGIEFDPFVLGFLPAYVIAKILDRLNWLRVPAAVEAAGLDTHDEGDVYPYFQDRETEFEIIERPEAADLVRADGRPRHGVTEMEEPR